MDTTLKHVTYILDEGDYALVFGVAQRITQTADITPLPEVSDIVLSINGNRNSEVSNFYLLSER
jgi:chemotaxis signal transduction protein